METGFQQSLTRRELVAVYRVLEAIANKLIRNCRVHWFIGYQCVASLLLGAVERNICR